MPNKYYERAKKILSRNDFGNWVSFATEDKFVKLEDRLDDRNVAMTDEERIFAVEDMLNLESSKKLSEVTEKVEIAEAELAKVKEEKKKFIAEHGEGEEQKEYIAVFDEQIKNLTAVSENANSAYSKVKNEENVDRNALIKAYKDAHDKNHMASEGEYISVYQQRRNVTNLMHLYVLAKKENRYDEMHGYEQALNERGISLDYAYLLASDKSHVETDQTKEDFENRINKISQIDDTFITKGKAKLGVTTVEGVNTPNIDRVISVYLQSGLNWKDFIGHVVYDDKDKSVFIEDKETADKLKQEIEDLKEQIKDVRTEEELGKSSYKYDDELDKLTEAWERAAENAQTEVKNDGEVKITDMFSDMKYDLFEKLSYNSDSYIEVGKLLACEEFKGATEEQQNVILSTVKLFQDQQREIEEKSAEFRKQLEEKQAKLTELTTKESKVDDQIADIKTAFESEKKFLANGEVGVANLFDEVKGFFKENYPVEVKNQEITIDSKFLKCTSVGSQARTDVLSKAADRFNERIRMQKEHSKEPDEKLRDSSEILLDVYKNKDKSFDEKKMCLKLVLDRKNELQSQIDGKNIFAKMFSAILPNSWTEIGRLKNEIKSLDTTVKSVVSEQDMKDMYVDPIDEPRDRAKADTLQPVFDYVKIALDYAKAKGNVYENIKKDIELMEGGVFAKDNKKVLDSLCDDLTALCVDGEFDKKFNADEKTLFNAQVFNAFDAIKKFNENGVLEIKDVLSEMQGPQTTEDVVSDLESKTANKNQEISEANNEKDKVVEIGSKQF